MSELPEIKWNDCYPTNESLYALADAPFVDFVVAGQWLRRELAKCAENCCASYREEDAVSILDRPVLHLHFSTSGWSGAEDLIAAIESRIDTESHMLQWQRGGHYVFEVKKP